MNKAVKDARPKMLASVTALVVCAARNITAGTTPEQLMKDYKFTPFEKLLARHAALLAKDEPDPANVGAMVRYVEQAQAAAA
jgi:hypothetical protein